MADILGTFEQAVVLAVMRLNDGAYGRTVLREVSVFLGREVAAGAVYATLDRLEEKNLLRSHTEAGTAIRAGRARRYYRVSAKGVASLNESKAALERLWSYAGRPIGAGA